MNQCSKLSHYLINVQNIPFDPSYPILTLQYQPLIKLECPEKCKNQFLIMSHKYIAMTARRCEQAIFLAKIAGAEVNDYSYRPLFRSPLVIHVRLHQTLFFDILTVVEMTIRVSRRR